MPKKSVSVEEFEEFKKGQTKNQEEIVSLISSLADKIEGKKAVSKEEEAEKSAEPGTNKSPIQPKWNTFVDGISKEIGRWMQFDDMGTPSVYLSIPKHLSNAGKNHWEMHHCDIRSCVVGRPDLSIDAWLKLVAKNLKIPSKN